MKPKIVVLCVAASLSAACAYPATMAEQGRAGGQLYVADVGAGTHIQVDGVDMGDATAFDGVKAVLDVKPGMRRVVLTRGGAVVFDGDIYVGAGAKVKVPPR